MSPELEDVLRKIAQKLQEYRASYRNGGTRDAIGAVITAIRQTIFELKEPK